MTRYRLDQACALPIAALERAGVFDTEWGGRAWRCVWRSGGTLVSSLRARWPVDSEGASGLRLDSTAHQDGRRVQHEYRIPVYLPIGQSRGRSFLCPLGGDGTNCLRRCRVLYCAPNTGHFGCRQCHGLTPARGPGPRIAVADLAAELTAAEQDLLAAASLTALPPAVERVAAAREAMARVLRAEIGRAAEVESLRIETEVALRGSPPRTERALRCYTKLRRMLREDLYAIVAVASPDTEAPRFEVSRWPDADNSIK
jgi:hypothetical protein